MEPMVIPKIDIVESTDDYARVVVEPLEPGFGITLGNALRRVLLSSLPGAAVTSVRVEQAQHEFSTVPHVKEDTMDFLLNVKGIRLKALANRPAKLYLDIRGEKVVTAGDIQCPPEYEIVNPDLYLATLDSPEARLTAEFTVDQGRGWQQSGRTDGMPIGVIPVDAIFTPVRKANFAVEHSRVGQLTTYDRLILEAWTDGTVSGAEAVSKSAQVLIDHFSLFGRLAPPIALPSERRGGLVPGLEVDPETYNMPIEELGLSMRAYNCLKRSGIMTMGQVLERTEEELMALRNFGRRSYDELREKLAAMGLLPAGQQVPAEAEEGEDLEPWKRKLLQALGRPEERQEESPPGEEE